MKEWEQPLTTNVGAQMYKNIIHTLTESAWAITPQWLDQIHNIVGRKMHGVELSADILGDMDYSHKTSVSNGTAVIPVQGPLFKKANMMTQYSGATSMEKVGNDFKAALANDDVENIVLKIDSGGGTIDGTKELSDLIYESRGQKPITAYVDGMAASAAYWIASAADKIVASSETALIGSVGVIAAHYDYSQYDEKMGVKKTYIYQGKYKGMAREAEPLSKEGKALIQGEIDGLYGIFIDSIAKNLGISSKDALNKTEDSKVFNSKEALERGLIHSIGTLDSVTVKDDSAETANEGKVTIKTIETK
ncbi:MAG: S49 family peptidase, partial [Deltaproteobacteria bacterium]|nr:S49 family peptidase [Deltaproteobacteria bacterium]